MVTKLVEAPVVGRSLTSKSAVLLDVTQREQLGEVPHFDFGVLAGRDNEVSLTRRV